MSYPVQVYKFGEFELNPAKRILFREAAEIKLRDKDFDILLFLINLAPKTCSHDEIIENVWNGTNVENNSIEKAVANIRGALSDNSREPRFIKTVRGKGYLFIGDASQVEENGSSSPILSLSDHEQNKLERYDYIRSHFFNIRKVMLFVVLFLSLLFGSLVWLKGGQVWARLNSKVILEDDFSGNEIDPRHWEITGNTVKIEDGIAKAECLETDNCGRLVSTFFPFDATKPVSVRTRTKISYSKNLKDKVYFLGFFGITFKRPNIEEIAIRDVSINGIYYANFDYSSQYPNGEINEFPAEGWFLFHGGGSPTKKVDYQDGKVSRRISPLWDEWIDQTVIWDPSNGKMALYINDELKETFNVGLLPADMDGNQIRIEIAPRGWWLYHSIHLDSIEVTQ